MRLATSHANRGRALETMVEEANRSYKREGVALIQKVPVPTKVIRIDGKPVAVWNPEQSTVDYIGVWGGRAVAFEAKENSVATRWELKNLHPHQVDFLASWADQGGLAWVLLFQVKDQAVYLLTLPALMAWWDGYITGTGRASIPVSEIRQLPRVAAGRGAVIDYLTAVERALARTGD